MPIPNSRQDLLNGLEESYARLTRELDQLDAESADQVCVDDWSVRDLLAVDPEGRGTDVAGALRFVSHIMKRRGIVRPLIGKLLTARCVDAPHKASSGTSSSPSAIGSTIDVPFGW